MSPTAAVVTIIALTFLVLLKLKLDRARVQAIGPPRGRLRMKRLSEAWHCTIPISRYLIRLRSYRAVYIFDQYGTPLCYVHLCAPDGGIVLTDARGLARLPASWLSQPVEIRIKDARTGAFLTVVKLVVPTSTDVIRITVPESQ